MKEETINELAKWKEETKPDTAFTLSEGKEEIIAGIQPIVVFVDPCEGCANKPDAVCTKYPGREDRQHTRIGGCAMDTRKAEKAKDNFKLNPLKASKRGVK